MKLFTDPDGPVVSVDTDTVSGIELKGPLSELITQALNVKYAKLDPATGKPVENVDVSKLYENELGQISLETQATDAALLENLSKAVTAGMQAEAENTVIYVFDKYNITPSTIVDVSDAIAGSDKGQVVIIEDEEILPKLNRPELSERQGILRNSLESLVERHGCVLHRGFMNYLRRH